MTNHASAGADRDCGDFANQAEAQAFFEANDPANDPHRLDANGDGIACESLPCPCAEPDDGGNPPPSTGNGKRGRVIEVTDGDTIKVRVKGKRRDVRILGIDTPEVFFGEECGAKKASRSMKRMLPKRSRIKLIRDRSQDNRDAFDRLLRYVKRKGKDVGKRQIAKGWAELFVFEEPFAYLERYERAQDRAKARGRGVWGRCGGDFHEPL